MPSLPTQVSIAMSRTISRCMREVPMTILKTTARRAVTASKITRGDNQVSSSVKMSLQSVTITTQMKIHREGHTQMMLIYLNFWILKLLRKCTLPSRKRRKIVQASQIRCRLITKISLLATRISAKRSTKTRWEWSLWRDKVVSYRSRKSVIGAHVWKW